MELRFIERDGKRILQQRVEHYITPYNDLDKRFAWQDVPFVTPPDVWCGPYGEQSVAKIASERDTLRALLNDAEARCARLEADHDTPRALLRTLAAEHANNLRAARDAGKRELRRVETERNELEAELDHQRGITRHWMRECERLEEKLKDNAEVDAITRLNYEALYRAVRELPGATRRHVWQRSAKIGKTL